MLAEGKQYVAVDNFTAWLEDELSARNWRPADLARVSGLPQATIGNILNGNRDIGYKTALSIARALNVPPDYVFRRAGILPAQPGPEHDLRFEEIVEIMRNLPEEERQEVLEYALFRFRRLDRKL